MVATLPLPLVMWHECVPAGLRSDQIGSASSAAGPPDGASGSALRTRRLAARARTAADPAPPDWLVRRHQCQHRRPRAPASAAAADATRVAADEYQLRTRYERNLPKWTGMAWQGAGVLLLLLGVSVTMYVWNARRLHILSEGGAGSRVLRFSRVFESAVRALIKAPPMRAGFLLLFRTCRNTSDRNHSAE